MEDNKNFVITIGRQFGSGGRVLGRLLAERLGIEFYDKKLLAEAARRSGVNAEFFEKADEKAPSFFSGLFSFSFGYNPIPYYSGSTSISDDSIYKAQSDFITSLAAKNSCIIVGRSADYVLRDHPRCVNLFVHAPIEDRVARIVKRGDKTTPEQARAMADKINKLRANYYNFYTDKTWGDAASYDLTFDSSLLPMEDIADIVVDYVKRRFKL
ncbi:MAG: cytidylate kinase-like family protein [Pseudoflavonifractor sp.]|nr:cytidylate kinase-like family protein [Pseudoflavonifractor sp.]